MLAWSSSGVCLVDSSIVNNVLATAPQLLGSPTTLACVCQGRKARSHSPLTTYNGGGVTLADIASKEQFTQCCLRSSRKKRVGKRISCVR